jgi:hypothetical protein
MKIKCLLKFLLFCNRKETFCVYCMYVYLFINGLFLSVACRYFAVLCFTTAMNTVFLVAGSGA